MWKPEKGFELRCSQSKSALSLMYNGLRVAQATWASGIPVMVGKPAPAKSTVTIGSDGPMGAEGLGQGQGLSPEGLKGAKALLGKGQTLHESLGHPSERVLVEAIDRGLIKGTDVTAEEVRSIEQCEHCIAGKQRRTPFPESTRKGTHKKGELIHYDYCGPLRVEAVGGYDGFILGVDDHSRVTSVVLMKGKNSENCFAAVLSIAAKMRRTAGVPEHSPQIMRFDRGKELVNNRFKKYCDDHGIKLETSTAYTSQQNGVAERTIGVD